MAVSLVYWSAAMKENVMDLRWADVSAELWAEVLARVAAVQLAEKMVEQKVEMSAVSEVGMLVH